MSKEAERLRRLAELQQQAAEAGEKVLRKMGDPAADLARASSKFTQQSAQLDTAMDRIGATLDRNIDDAEVDAVVKQAQEVATLELLRSMPEPPKGVPGVASASTSQKLSPGPALPTTKVVSARIAPPAAVLPSQKTTSRPTIQTRRVVSSPVTTPALTTNAQDSFEAFKAKIDARIADGQKEVAAYCKQQGLNIDQAKRAFAESMTGSKEEITAKRASFNPGTIEYKILDAALKMIDIDRRINNQNIADANSVPASYRSLAMAYSANNIVAKKNNSRNRVEERIRLKRLLERRGIQEVEKRPGLFGRVTRQIKKWREKLAGKPKSTLTSAAPAPSPAAEAPPSRDVASKIAEQIRTTTVSDIRPGTSPSTTTARRGQVR
jgi:hypothetical protein